MLKVQFVILLVNRSGESDDIIVKAKGEKSETWFCKLPMKILCFEYRSA
jgi:hypothetical protein